MLMEGPKFVEFRREVVPESMCNVGEREMGSDWGPGNTEIGGCSLEWGRVGWMLEISKIFVLEML